MSRTLHVQASSSSSVEDAPSRCQKLLKVLGLDGACVDGDLTVEELRQLQELRLIMMCLHWMIMNWGVLV